MRKVEKTLLQNQQNNKVTNFNKKKKKAHNFSKGK